MGSLYPSEQSFLSAHSDDKHSVFHKVPLLLKKNVKQNMLRNHELSHHHHHNRIKIKINSIHSITRPSPLKFTSVKENTMKNIFQIKKSKTQKWGKLLQIHNFMCKFNKDIIFNSSFFIYNECILNCFLLSSTYDRVEAALLSLFQMISD